MKNHAEKFLTGNIYKNILALSLPVFINFVVQALFNIVDTIYVAHLGTPQLAALTLSFPIQMFMIAFIGGAGVGVSSLIARKLGANDKKGADNVAEHGLLLAGVITLFFISIGLWITNNYLPLIGAAENVSFYLKRYLDIIFIGSFTLTFMWVMNSILNGEGDMKTPMKVGLFATFLNIVLDPLLIFGLLGFPRLGIAGAAIATIFSRFVGMSIIAYYLLKDKAYIRLSLKDFRYRTSVIVDILRVGIPATLSHIAISISWALENKIISLFGTLFIAAYGLGARLNGVAIMPAFAFAIAATTLVGMAVGRKDQKKAKEIALKTALMIVIFMGTIGIIINNFAHIFLLAFTRDTEIITQSVLFLKRFTWSYPFFGIIFVLTASLNGAGRSLMALLVVMIRALLFTAGLAYLFGIVWQQGPIGVYTGVTIGIILAGLISIIILLKIRLVKVKS